MEELLVGEAVDTADCACEAIQVGLCAIEHVVSIALKNLANLKLVKLDKALSS